MSAHKTPADLADAAAEAVRALNHVTHLTQSGWEYPADAYSVIGGLREVVQHLPQLYGQIADLLQTLADGDHIRSDQGDSGADNVVTACDGLARATGDAEAMCAALDTVHAALSPLAYKD